MTDADRMKNADLMKVVERLSQCDCPLPKTNQLRLVRSVLWVKPFSPVWPWLALLVGELNR